MAPNVVLFEWMTTSPNPRHPGTGYDAGQRGWRLHAVLMVEGESSTAYKYRTSLCGTRPRYGWGLDMFIDEQCSRCCAKMDKMEQDGAVFMELHKVVGKKMAKENKDD